MYAVGFLCYSAVLLWIGHKVGWRQAKAFYTDPDKWWNRGEKVNQDNIPG